MVYDCRHKCRSIDVPWNTEDGFIFINGYNLCMGSIIDIITQKKTWFRVNSQTKYWIILPWYSEDDGQHKSYRNGGDYEKLIDDLTEYHAVIFCMRFEKDTDGKYHGILINNIECYALQMWGGDMRYMDTIAAIKLCLTDEEVEEFVTPVLDNFVSKLQKNNIYILTEITKIDMNNGEAYIEELNFKYEEPVDNYEWD